MGVADAASESGFGFNACVLDKCCFKFSLHYGIG